MHSFVLTPSKPLRAVVLPSHLHLVMLSSCGVEKKPRRRKSLGDEPNGDVRDSHRLHLLRERVRRHRARSSFSSEDLQCDLPLGSLRIPSPRPSGNMVVDPSDGLTPDGTDAHMLRDLELNRERVKLYRARQVSFSVSLQPVSSSMIPIQFPVLMSCVHEIGTDNAFLASVGLFPTLLVRCICLNTKRRLFTNFSIVCGSLLMMSMNVSSVWNAIMAWPSWKTFARDAKMRCVLFSFVVSFSNFLYSRCSQSEGHRYDAGNFAVNAKFCRPAVGPQPRFPGLPSHFSPSLSFPSNFRYEESDPPEPKRVSVASHTPLLNTNRPRRHQSSKKEWLDTACLPERLVP